MLDLQKELERVTALMKTRHYRLSDYKYGDRVSFLFNGDKSVEGSIEKI